MKTGVCPKSLTKHLILMSFALVSLTSASQVDLVIEPGHPSLQTFLLPDYAPSPEGNELNQERIYLGKKLFFDPRLSGSGSISCASCHNPALGWSDGLPTGIGHNGAILHRATPTIINTGFNSIQMWDGREKSLESQATGPLDEEVEMSSDMEEVVKLLKGIPGYVTSFNKAYPEEPISRETISKALAAYERTIVSNQSPFDRWIKGDESAMTDAQVRGFEAFMDPERGNCAVCHSGANFTDNGFHNLGLPSANLDEEHLDLGRYKVKPIGLMKGAFKTPTLRDIDRTAPYFHDGSATTLEEVVQHYIDGPVEGVRASPNFTPAKLTEAEIDEIVEFMRALTSDQQIVLLPELPQ